MIERGKHPNIQGPRSLDLSDPIATTTVRKAATRKSVEYNKLKLLSKSKELKTYRHKEERNKVELE